MSIKYLDEKLEIIIIAYDNDNHLLRKDTALSLWRWPNF